MTLKRCELCGSEAKTYCESDRARLCWDCDARVHGANFLVAKHSRSLLCRVCHSPTPWYCSGPTLCPTVSVCQTCLDKSQQTENDQPQEHDHRYNHSEEEEDYDDDVSCDDDSEEEEEEDCIEEEEDEENQVVPWSKPGSDQQCSKSNGLFGTQSSSAVSDTAFSWRSRFS